MIITWEGPREVILGQEEYNLVQRLLNALGEAGIGLPEVIIERDGENYKMKIRDNLDLAFYYAAMALKRADDPADEVVFEAGDLFTALAVRGILRVIGIHAKIRILPGGGTRRQHLYGARDRLSLLSSFAFHD